MRTQSYPSDVTDERWALIEPHLPVYPGGRPRTTDLRNVVDAVFDVLRTGCQWRYLPKDVPPRSTVWRSSGERRRDGTLDTPRDLLRRRGQPVGGHHLRGARNGGGTTPRTWTGGSGTSWWVPWGCC